jgi:hypothetical protein
MLKNYVLGLIVLFAGSVMAYGGNNVGQGVINFDNFGEEYHLYPEGELYRTEYGLLVHLTGSLIVKTSSAVNREQVSILNGYIETVRTLFTGEDFIYYLVYLHDKKLLNQALDALKQSPVVQLVQPDLLQINKRASSPSSLAFAHGSQEDDEHRYGLTDENIISARFNTQYGTYLKSIGVDQLHKKTLGENTRIAIIDDGIFLAHPALEKTRLDFSFDLESLQSSAVSVSRKANHGTRVAGVIYAQKQDAGDRALAGIAPKAGLVAIRQWDTLTSKTLLAFQTAQLANADIINCSWNSHWLLQPVADVVTELSENGREGKGAAVIFSAGNEGEKIEPLSIEASLESAIVVGAVNYKGNVLANSNYGSSVDLFVFGKRVRSTIPFGQYGRFSGTSLSAAITSGLAALLLSLQPEMNLQQLEQKLKMHTELVGRKS